MLAQSRLLRMTRPLERQLQFDEYQGHGAVTEMPTAVALGRTNRPAPPALYGEAIPAST